MRRVLPVLLTTLLWSYTGVKTTPKDVPWSGMLRVATNAAAPEEVFRVNRRLALLTAYSCPFTGRKSSPTIVSPLPRPVMVFATEVPGAVGLKIRSWLLAFTA